MDDFVQSRIIIKGGSGNEVAINKIKKFNDNYILATINEIQNNSNKQNENNSNEQNENKLGQGSFGSVYLYNDKVDNSNGNKKYAVKQIEIANDFEYDKYLKELLILDVLRTNCQTHVMCYKESYIDFETSKVYIVCEYLDDYVVLTEYYNNAKSETNNPNIEALAKLFHNLINGMNKMHEMNVYHRDIKPDNIMYNTKTYDVKYIDFGLSILPVGNKRIILPTSTKLKVGTPNYMDPNITTYEKKSEPAKYEDMIKLLKNADRFSLGMTLFMLLSNGKLIYQLTNTKINYNIELTEYYKELKRVLQDEVFNNINDIDKQIKTVANKSNLTYESYKSLLGINDEIIQTTNGGNPKIKHKNTKKTKKRKRSCFK